jgi:GWxTD domain-containing protein
MRISIALIALALASHATAPDIDWINSPEAYFATAGERAEWFRLTTDAQRDVFQKRFWLMRDPTPNTEKNEFKEVILDRIRKADGKFSIKDGPQGSLTAQGMVYIVFGPPAFIRTAPGGGVLRPTIVNGIVVPNTMTEPTDVITTWIYDTHRTPRLMEMLGRPELEITIAIEPTRRRDVLQSPGLFDQYRAVLANRSVVNAHANVVIAPSATEIPAARLDAPIPDRIRVMLRDAKPFARSNTGVVFNASELWSPNGTAAIAVFTVPNAVDRTAHLTTYGEIRAGERVVATIGEPFVSTEAVTAAGGSRSELLRLDLPPGSYDGSFALVDDRTSESLLTVSSPIRVLDPSVTFGVTSLLLSGDPIRGANAPFAFGNIVVQPRADVLFHRNESLWYFAVVRSAQGADNITAEVQLRHAGKPVAARTFTPRMDEIAPSVFLLGEELPLERFETGDYSLYLVVHGGTERSEVRRADFRIGS